MAASARLVATIAAPLDPASADAPWVLHWPGRRLLVQRGDSELVTLDLRTPGEDSTTEVRFPAPWPRRFGTVTVSPEQDAAVFAGVHGVRVVDATGTTRWEVRHGCWCETCSERHLAFHEYAQDAGHLHVVGGSAAYNSDGTLVWVHVRGPLGSDADTSDADPEDWDELWAVLEAGSGKVLGHVDTETVSSGSRHTPPPFPDRMGLSVGEGEEGSPVLWGWWNGQELTTDEVDTERILLDVSPTGRYLLTVPVGQWSLALHSAEDGSVERKLEAAGTVPEHPMSAGGDRVYWDYEAAFVAEDTIIAGTSECDTGSGTPRHWVVDARGMTLQGEVVYPFPVSGPARSAGDGIWYTVSEDGAAVHLWQLAEV